MFNKRSEDKLNLEIKRQLVKHSELILDLENKRERNLLSKCNSINTFISILLVPLITIIFELYDRLYYAKKIIIFAGIFLIIILIISLVYSIIAQSLYKNCFPTTNEKFEEHINKYKEEFTHEKAFLNQQYSDNNFMYKTLDDNNNKRVKYIQKSFLFIKLFFAFLALFSIIILVMEVRDYLC